MNETNIKKFHWLWILLFISAGALLLLSLLKILFEQITSHSNSGYVTLGSILLSILLLYFLHKKTEGQKPKEEQEHFVVYLVFGLMSLFFIVFCFFVSFSLFSHFFPYIDKPISLGINALGMVLIIIFLYFLHRKINPKKPKDEQFLFIHYIFFGFAVLFLIALFVGSAISTIFFPFINKAIAFSINGLSVVLITLYIKEKINRNQETLNNAKH